MSDFQLWQRQVAGEDVVTWELEVDGQRFEREVSRYEMVSDDSFLWVDIQAEGRALAAVRHRISMRHALGGVLSIVDPDDARELRRLQTRIAALIFPEAADVLYGVAA